ncbi:RagB/SusD family nutrient uptake outer membrane protein [Longitalea luteola]|uniref:RagB/SusD family nutrient uptake outer membrane protein n=1 Tax=Longitalea luteola TaxID=2812563 RepID=UPI001A974904|nr:RagB/SusD family nutrient uptake outer membrane protein [Longitalea luteola]
MNRLTFITVVFCAIVFTGCTKLDFYPHSAASPDNVSEKDLDPLMKGMYNAVQNFPGRESYIMYDLVGGNLTTASGGNVLAFIKNIMRTDYSLVRQDWNGYFRALYQVNNVLQIMERMPDTDKKTQVAGVAHFLRAYIYYNLTTRWGDVPLLRVNTSELVSRTAQAEIWKFIEEDLLAAMTQAPGFITGLNGDYYLASREAAQALMARVKLAQGKNSEAAEYAERLITSGLFQLDRFEKIFRKQDNKEVIFAFENLTEESSITLSTLFYTYAHPVKGSYVYKPTDEVMNMYEAGDNRRAMSIDTYTNLDVINKYPSGQAGTDPVIIIRLAEMYLISAEAQGLNGLNRLNELRAARNLSALNPSSVDEYQQAVALERRRELLAEGFRWYDLVRTGKAVDALGIEPFRTKFPVPDYERLVNENLGQNDGYVF